MRFKNGEIAIIVSILLFSSTAHTAGGYVNFMGQVVAPSCTVTGTLDIQSNNDIAKRIDLSKASLKTLGLL